MTNVSAWRIKFEAQRDVSMMAGISSLGKEVHYQLVYHSNIDTRRCYPSEERLSGYVSKSTRSVRTALKHLEERGVISIRPRGGRNGTNQYDLHVLERKISTYRPEENCTHERKVPAGKQKNKHKKEKGAGGRELSQNSNKTDITGLEEPPLAHELVTSPKEMDAWYDLVSTLNIGSPNKVLELTRGENGYRLPSQTPDNETGSRAATLAFFLRVLSSRGECLD